MPRRGLTVCNITGCPNLTRTGRCPTHQTQAHAQRRATPHQQHYKTTGHKAFREAVLARDPWCRLCHAAPSNHADHHPLGLDELLEQGLNPNDPSRGRGLCQPCHAAETARKQPGGWNRRGGG